MTDRRRIRRDMVAVFLLAFLPRLIFSLQIWPIRVLSDEIATISGGAYFAGLDWSRVISHAGYYGSGFSAFFAPIFRLTDDPFVIYRSISVICSILQSAVAPICYHLLARYFEVENVKTRYLLSVTVSFMVVTRATLIYNEHIMIFLTWIMTWLLLKLHTCVEERGKVRILTLVLACILSYTLTIHTRALVYWPAVACVVFGYWLVYKRWLVSKCVILPILPAGYVLAGKFITHMQQTVWLSGAGGGLRNSQIILNVSSSLTNPVTWKGWISIILGQINTITMFSGGWMLICLLTVFSLGGRKLCDRFGQRSMDIFSEEEQRESALLICGVFGSSAMVMTIAGQSVLWLDGVVQAMCAGFKNDAYVLKALTYIRYFGPYIGPIFLAGVLYLYWNERLRRRFLLAYMTIAGVLQILWLTMMLPYVYHNYDAAEAYRPWGLWRYGDETTLKVYLAGSLMLLCSSFIIWIGWRLKKETVAFCTLLPILLYTYCYSAWFLNIEHGKAIGYAKGNMGYEVIQALEENYEIDDSFYVVDGVPGRENNFNYYEYQFLMNRYTIIPEMPPEDAQDILVFCNKSRYEPLLEQGYESYTLDRNEYIYIRGGKYQRWLEDLGFIREDNQNRTD